MRSKQNGKHSRHAYMALTQEQKDAIEMGMSEFTHAELAQKHGCSRSTVARVIAKAKAADTERAATAESKEGEVNESGGDGESKVEDKPVDNFEYVPETEERSTIIELQVKRNNEWSTPYNPTS